MKACYITELVVCQGTWRIGHTGCDVYRFDFGIAGLGLGLG